MFFYEYRKSVNVLAEIRAATGDIDFLQILNIT